MTPSISPYERRDYLEKLNKRERLQQTVGFLVTIVLTLGIIFLLWDLFTFPEVEAAPVVDDKYICQNLEKYDIEGMEAEVIRYCSKYGL